MLEKFKTFSSFSTNDLQKTKEFYVDKLGLNVLYELDGVIAVKASGDNEIMIYLKDNHTPATYTTLYFVVDDLKKVINELKEKGVATEQYPDFKTDELGISEGSGVLMAWIKDPAGNILALLQHLN